MKSLEVDISIIIVNYNTSGITCECVSSIDKYTPCSINLEFIVVDNNSEDEEFLDLDRQLNEKNNIYVVRSRKNLGFGGGNNFGVNFCSGKYYAFINSDVIFTEDCFSRLLEVMQVNAGIGCCTPMQVSSDGSFVPSFDHTNGILKDSFGREFLQVLNPKKYPKRWKFDYEKVLDVGFINGCFMLFRGDVFCDIGGFDQNIFLYGEELDICVRTERNGYLCSVVPDVKFTHIHGESTRSVDIKKELLISRIYLYKKHFNSLKYLCLWWLILIKLFFKLPFRLKQFPLFWLCLRGVSLDRSMMHSQKIRKK